MVGGVVTYLPGSGQAMVLVPFWCGRFRERGLSRLSRSQRSCVGTDSGNRPDGVGYARDAVADSRNRARCLVPSAPAWECSPDAPRPLTCGILSITNL